MISLSSVLFLVLTAAGVTGAQAYGQARRGDVLAFASDRHGRRDIFIIDVTHGISLNLTQDRLFDDAPAWSPDGRLAFESYRRTNAGIFVIDTVTRELTQVTPANGAFMPTWSPDGRLAYVTTRSGNLEIILYDFVTGARDNITNAPASDMNPTWSLDGRLAFDSFREEDSPGQIYVMNPDSGGARSLRNSQSYYDPAWSPDGLLAVVSGRSGSRGIYLLNPNTGEVSVLVDTPANESQPAWSAAGLLAYMVDYNDGVGELYVYNPTTGEAHNVTRNTFNDFSPAWMP
jgi:Tol biopolymer transport system component